jgi:ABC-type phosphate transport system substrate-binding protein
MNLALSLNDSADPAAAFYFVDGREGSIEKREIQQRLEECAEEKQRSACRCATSWDGIVTLKKDGSAPLRSPSIIIELEVDHPGLMPAALINTSFATISALPKDPARTNTAIDFFKWALENGQKQANDLDYMPLPESLVKKIEIYWKIQFSGLKG